MKNLDGIKVSIIVYVKNGEKYIEQCIRSLMDQTLREIEIIVVDGNSTDNTLKLIHSLMLIDNRIHLYKGPSSVGAQFNLGMSAAQGEYVGICEADDYVECNMYETLYDIAQRNNCDIAKADYFRVYTIGQQDEKIYQSTAYEIDKDRLIEVDNNVSLVYEGIWRIWSGIYSRDFLIKYNIKMNETPGASYQDNTFSFLCQMYVRRLWTSSVPLYCYRIDNPDASVNSKDCMNKHTREYKCLEIELKQRSKWALFKDAFFFWEMSSYTYFYYGLRKDDRNKTIKDFYTELRNQATNENIATEYNGVMLGDAIYFFNQGYESFYDYLEKRTVEKEIMVDTLRNISSQKTIVLFGLGHFGSIIYRYLLKKGIKPILMDNDNQKQLNGFEGCNVSAPHKIKAEQCLYIIANIQYAREMAKQVVDDGVEESEVLICQDENRFIREVLINAD